MRSLATTQGIQTSKLPPSIRTGTESGFKRLRTWPGCSLAAHLLGILLTTISGVNGPKKRRYPTRQKMPGWEGSGDNGRTGARWQKVRRYLNNHWLITTGYKQGMENSLSECSATAAGVPTGRHSCLLRTGKWGCKSYPHHRCAANTSAATAGCYPAHTGRNLWGILPTPAWKFGTKNEDGTAGKRGSSLFTSCCILRLHLWSGGVVMLS